jgi:hypothetical protein
MDSEKYAYVNIVGEQPIYVRIRKDFAPMQETDKAKLTDWANRKGFTVSRRKRILHAE